jgi:hypothetical protein
VRLIPNLPTYIILAMDNALYHNIQIDPAPISNAKKSTKISWLNEKKNSTYRFE